MTTLMRASNEWARRPDDERYLSLDDLGRAVRSRRVESWTATPDVRDLRVQATAEGDVAVEVFDPTAGERKSLLPTHHGFGQLASYGRAPAAYLRRLPADLAAINLQWGLERFPIREDSLILARSNGNNTMRSITSTSYGRIWDHQVVDAVQRVNEDGRWVVPAATYSETAPKRATTLYASDRDVFIFLVDPKNPIDIPGQDKPLFRGFYAWNSEVGAATFGLTTFLYNYVCDNRMIWGATDIRELRIRHTAGAPDRFGYEGRKYLERYANESTQGIVSQITKAKTKDVPLAKDESVSDWLQARGFTRTAAKASHDAAVVEEGQARSVWDVIQGVTAYARTIPHTDDRVAIERKAGALMRFVDA